MITPSITDNAVYRALGGYLSSCFECTVIRGQVNDTPMPQGSFILMNDVWKKALATNSHEYGEDSQDIKTHTEYCIQVDFYGENSGEMAQSFITLIQDSHAFYAFPAGIKPLYATDPRQIPLVTGEKNYLERWTTEVHLQFNPTVTTPVAMIDELPVFPILANGL